MLLYAIFGCTSQSTEPLTNDVCTWDDFPTQSYALLPDEPITQIHSDIAFDGEKIWMVYNLPNAQNKFDVYLTALGCDGAVVWGPEHILDLEGVNQTTPRIAVSGDRVLVAAQGDNSASGNNLSIQLHLQDTDGNLLSERAWAPILDEGEIGNHWLPSIVGYQDGFWIAAAAANESYFRTLVQALDMDGEPIANAHWVGPESYAVYPNIDSKEDQYAVAWDDQENVYWTTGDLSGDSGMVEVQENASFARILWDGDEPQLFTSQRSPSSVLLNGESVSNLSDTHFPNAAVGETSMLYTHFQIQSGFQNDLLYGYVSNGVVEASDQVLTTDPPAAPYRPSVTHLSGDSYFVVWSQGNNPDFTLWGSRIALATD